MADLRHIHQYMAERRRVLTDDGRVGRIVRVDTAYPEHSSTVSLWTEAPSGPGLAKVHISAIVGPALLVSSA